MLRTFLDEITDYPDIGAHANKIEQARKVYSHSIDALTKPNENLRYNCVMFAFGIETDSEYFLMALRCPEDVHANTAFVQFLADRGYIVEQSSAEPKALAVYFNDGQVRHIGRVIDNDRVQSKWGIGHLYEHAIFEVPATYGDVVRFFGAIERDLVLDAFFEFAERQGVSFENRNG
jgi:hypothetical protein